MINDDFDNEEINVELYELKKKIVDELIKTCDRLKTAININSETLESLNISRLTDILADLKILNRPNCNSNQYKTIEKYYRVMQPEEEIKENTIKITDHDFY